LTDRLEWEVIGIRAGKIKVLVVELEPFTLDGDEPLL
jgi:hypothetical protein